MVSTAQTGGGWYYKYYQTEARAGINEREPGELV
jgi:hypothetical protein